MSKPTRVDKPWGHELWWAETDHYAGKILVVNAVQALSLQFHREKDETSYLLSGKLRLTHGPNAETLSDLEIEPGQAWRNEPGTVHSIEALEESVVLEVSTPHLDDVVRLRDLYGGPELTTCAIEHVAALGTKSKLAQGNAQGNERGQKQPFSDFS